MKMKIRDTTMILFVNIFIIGCGNSTSSSMGNQNTTDMNENQKSNIPYLKQNHAKYKQHGSMLTPVSVKDENKKSINWTISATSEEGAMKLQEHLYFMENKLNSDQNPRAFDTLFLMEAYMKYNRYYTTLVERSGTDIVVSKNAKTMCAYKVISAHSDAVSGDFFAQGNIMKNYSSIAEEILASKDCDNERASLQRYISERKKGRM